MIDSIDFFMCVWERERETLWERERDWDRGQSKAVVVLYRGNDLGLEGQDTNSEARDIYKYIFYIYIYIYL